MKTDYSPKNYPSKRITSLIKDDFITYEAGGYCRGHKTRHKDNQSLNQLVRTREKRIANIAIQVDLQDFELN